MQTRKLELACPVCHSTEVFYTCTPDCCFNHVCDRCGATFEPVTKWGGRSFSGVIPPDAPPDPGDPTVACRRCDSTAVCQAGAGELVCAKCGALLEVEYTEIALNRGSG